MLFLKTVKKSMAFSICVLVFTFSSCKSHQEEDNRIVLSEKGQALANIITRKQASATEKTAAAELSDYLKKVTGSEFPVLPEDELPNSKLGIFIGNTKFANKTDIHVDKLNDEEFIIKSFPDKNIVIAGAGQRGTLYGVYTFLEDIIGVRWWTLDEEYIPNKPTLVVPQLNIHEKPAFKLRDIYGMRFFGNKWPFLARNKTNGGTFKGRGDLPLEYGGYLKTLTLGHSTLRFVPPEKYYNHPEWYVNSKGEHPSIEELKENKNTFPNLELCYSNQTLQKQLFENIIETIKKELEKEKENNVKSMAVSIWQMDNKITCNCDLCKNMRIEEKSEGAPFWGFMTQMAEKLKKVYPNIKLECLPYQWSSKPPEKIVFPDNIIITYAPVTQNICQSLSEGYNKREGCWDELLSWKKKCSSVRTWIYCSPFTGYQGLPLPNLTVFRDDLQSLHKEKIDGIHFHALGRIMFDQPDMYQWIAAKLLWDPNQDWNKLVSNFTDGYYGEAGKYIREYFKLLDKEAREKHHSYITWKARLYMYNYLTPDFIIKAQDIFDKAEDSVKNDPDILVRVRRCRASIDRATLSLWPEISNIDTNIKKEDVLSRLNDTWNNIVRRMFNIRFSANADINKNFDAFSEGMNREFKKWETVVKNRKSFSKLPMELENIPVNKTVSILAENIVGEKIGEKIIVDQSSPGGLSEKCLVKDFPIKCGIYDLELKINKEKLLKESDIIQNGYHAYYIGNIQKKQNVTIYFGDSWDVVFYNDNIRSKASSEINWKVYISIKIVPKSKDIQFSKPIELYIDRLILIPEENK